MRLSGNGKEKRIMLAASQRGRIITLEALGDPAEKPSNNRSKRAAKLEDAETALACLETRKAHKTGSGKKISPGTVTKAVPGQTELSTTKRLSNDGLRS